MVPLDRATATLYRLSKVTTFLSAAVGLQFQIQHYRLAVLNHDCCRYSKLCQGSVFWRHSVYKTYCLDNIETNQSPISTYVV